MKTTITFCFIFLMSFPILGQNQDIAAFSGTSSPNAAAIEHITASALKRGPGLNQVGIHTFNSNGWSTAGFDNKDYVEWSVTAAPGHIINITKVKMSYGRDFGLFTLGAGPSNIELRTSLDNFNANIFTDNSISFIGDISSFTTALTSEVNGTITFRLYGHSTDWAYFGNFFINGGLNTVLGLPNTGIKLIGSVVPEGLLYTGGNWMPSAPDANSGNTNAVILSGTYTEANNVQLKNLTVNPGAGFIIKNTGSITVNGDLTTANNVTLESSSIQYSSLIVTGKVTGTTKYQRHVNISAATGSKTGANDLISAPVTGETFNSFRAKNPNLRSNADNTKFLFGPFNKATGTYITYSSTENAILTPATGYRAATTNNDYLTFTGTVNTQVVTIPMSNSGPYYKTWNLVGNPYSSYINTKSFLNTNISQLSPTTAAIYGYDGEASNGWTIVNLASLLKDEIMGINGNTKITPGQGFFLASKEEGGTIIFEPSMRTPGNTDDFILGRKTNTAKIGFINLKISNHTQNYSTEIYFNEHSTKGMDVGYDASIYGGNAPAFSVYTQLIENNKGEDIGIQSLSYEDLQNGVIVPLGLKAALGQEVNLSIAESILPEGTEVYLEDKLTNTFTLLTTSDFSFTASSNLNAPGRFFLHFSKTTLSNSTDELDSLIIFTDNSQRRLVVKGFIKTKTVVNIYDLQARLITSTRLHENETNNAIDMSHLSSGVYVIELKSDTMTKTQKVILK